MLNKTKVIRQRLKRLAELLADEAERNPEFADALAEALGIASMHEKQMRTKRVTAPDPFDAYRSKGPEVFRLWLNELSIQELRGIVRQQRFDPSRLSDKWKTKERFVQLICDRVENRAKQGEAFRHYGKDPREPESPHSQSSDQ